MLANDNRSADRPLTDKVALITGGSRGIGGAIARRLAGDGAHVAVTYVKSAEKANAVVREIEAVGRRGLAIQADSADHAAVVRAVEQTAAEFGQLDILVNNAGIYPFGPLEQVTLEEIDQTLAIHVRAVFVASQTAVRFMGAGGRIINIGSCFAERVPYAGVSLYAMSKTALIGLTKGLARDLGERGIAVSLVHPGNTDTDMNPANRRGLDAELGYVALGHFAEPDDVAATVAYLAGEGGRYVTGTSISVDGGYAA